MSRASNTSKRSRRLSKNDNTDGASAQSSHFDEQPLQEQDNLRSADDGEEILVPLVPTSTRISKYGPPQQPGPHVHENTPNDLPKGALAAEAQKGIVPEDQPSPSELVNIMAQVLDVLKDSTIASKTGKDSRSHFWGLYKRVAEEHDDEFLERYNGDMDIVLIFSGLFSAVSTAFIVAMESNLSPDPDDTTHALLTQLVQIGLGNFTAAGSAPASPASTWSPSTVNIRIQSIAYASLSFSLLAAFGAVLGKQWLGYYKSHRYGRGSEEERAKRRQERFDGIVTWHFDAVVQLFPILLQFSLLLFGIALSANMWYKQYTIAWVIIATTVFGFLFYSLTVMAALVSPACPFQTPISTILLMLRFDKVLCPMAIWASRYLQQLVMPVHGVLQSGLDAVHSQFYRYQYDQYHSCRTQLAGLADSVFAACSFAWGFLQPLFRRLLPWRSSSTRVMDSEAQPPDRNLHVVTTNQCPLKLKLPDTPISALEAPSIMWLLETSTDPEVFLAAARLVPHVDWPLDLDVSGMLRQLYDVYTTCLDVQELIIPSLEKKASACTIALCHLYYGRILQGRPVYGFLGEGSTDYNVFCKMFERAKGEGNVVVATTKLFVAKYGLPFVWRSSPEFGACPDPVLKWLSHALPFHFVTGRVDADVEKLAITVMSTLICSSPSPQIIANCTVLACVMIGVQFDKKDIVRVDKSSALPQLAESLWTQFQKVLWASQSDPYGDSARACRRAWNLLDVIYRVLALGPPDTLSRDTMWILGVYRKIQSRASIVPQDHSSNAFAGLPVRQAPRFRFTIFSDPTDPGWVWWHQIMWESDSHTSKDFDWLVDFLHEVYSKDHETAGDILVLLSSMWASCSPTKQHLYVKKLIACMGSSMPPRLRHAALLAAHSSREVLASINVVDDALSLAILTAVCPQPGVTSTDGPDRFFHYNRDLCYLELIFALARNSYWRPHLCCQIDRAIRMITVCCESYAMHTFYLAGIFLRMTSEQVSSFSSITEQQWWDMMRKAWPAFLIIDSTRCVKLLPVLVEGTKKYMYIASKSDLEVLIEQVDNLIGEVEMRDLLEQIEGVDVAVQELRGMANDMLAESS